LVLAITGAATARAEQQPPPIDGVTGTVATEESKKDVKEAGRGVFGKMARKLGLGKDKEVPSTPEGGGETLGLAGMKAGTAVIIHTTTAGENATAEEIERQDAEGVKPIEGVITAVNPSERTIAIRLADGTRRMLRLSAHAADEVDTNIDATAKVVLYVKDVAGERVVHTSSALGRAARPYLPPLELVDDRA
jgi:hypothetical protein